MENREIDYEPPYYNYVQEQLPTKDPRQRKAKAKRRVSRTKRASQHEPQDVENIWDPESQIRENIWDPESHIRDNILEDGSNGIIEEGKGNLHLVDGSNGTGEAKQEDLDLVETKVKEGAALEEEIKNALKFSYFSTGMAGAGILGFLSGSISNQKEQINGIHLKICIVLTLATIISGASMILITLLHSRTCVSIRIIKYLKYATLGLLTVATFDASILFLEVYALLAFVPTAIVVVVAFITAPRHDKSSSSHYQSNGSFWWSFNRRS